MRDERVSHFVTRLLFSFSFSSLLDDDDSGELLLGSSCELLEIWEDISSADGVDDNEDEDELLVMEELL